MPNWRERQTRGECRRWIDGQQSCGRTATGALAQDRRRPGMTLGISQPQSTTLEQSSTRGFDQSMWKWLSVLLSSSSRFRRFHPPWLCTKRRLFHSQLPRQERQLERLFVNDLAEGSAPGVAGLGVVHQQNGKAGLGGSLQARSHLAGLFRRDSSVRVSAGEEHGGVLGSGLHMLIRRICIEKLELRRVRCIAILQKRRWIVVLGELIVAHHIEVR